MSISLFASLARRFGETGSPMGRPTDAQRRDFLRASLLTGAGLLAGGAPAPRRARAGDEGGGRVIVIGAGLAGLACAYELTQAGRDVLVLEARGRVGGRVLSFSDAVPGAPGRMVEAGGEFIGANHPLWVACAAKFGLRLLEIPDEPGDAPMSLEGAALTKGEAKALHEEMEASLRELTTVAARIDADAPWTGADAAGLDAVTIGRWIDAQPCSPRCRLALRAQFETDNGVAVENQSLLGNLALIKGGGLEAFWTQSETHRCEGGNRRLAEAFARELGSQRLRVRTAVKAVERTEDGARVVLASNETLEADQIVLAVPPSVWGGIAFSPALPEGLAHQMGPAVKWLAGVRRRFWRDAGLSADALTDGDVGMVWEATSCERADENLLLTAFSAGPAAGRCSKRDAQSREECYRKEIAALFPGLMGAFTGSRFIDWPSDTFTMGGYTFPAPGAVTTTSKALREGLPRVRFAGEHCSSAFVGYMEGALQSGVRVAREMAAGA